MYVQPVSTRCATGLVLANGQQPSRQRRDFAALDVYKLALAEVHGVFNESRGRLAKHHSARRRDRLHPLRHADLFADCGVTGNARADFAGDDLS